MCAAICGIGAEPVMSRKREQNAARRRRAAPEFGLRLGETIRGLVNPVDLFSGARLGDDLLVGNVVLFKRTSARMLRPQGVTHNHHHRFELVIPIRQSGRIHVDGVGHLLAPGQVFLIFPHQFHHYLDVGNKGMNWLFITFEMEKPEALLPLRNAPRSIGPEEEAHLDRMLKDYLARAPAGMRSLNLILKVSELLRRVLLAPPADCAVVSDTRESDPTGAILQSINRYVRAHINQPLALADLARHTGYSISHLRAVFRKELGVSLGGYLRDSRLSLAASMLADRNRDSIQGIARACGFVSIFAFSRAFKNAMGLSPSAYSKSIQGGADSTRGTEPAR